MPESDVFIDDVRLQDLGITVRISSQEFALPRVRNQSIVVPNRHGAFDFGGWVEPREFILDCVVNRRENYTEVKRVIQQLKSLMLDEWVRPRTVKLRFGDEPQVYYKARLTDAIPFEPLAKLGLISVPLTAFDPHAYFLYSTTNIILNSDIPVLSDITLGAQYEFDINPTPTQAIVCDVINDGTVAVRPTILITGEADYINFWNKRTGEIFFINDVRQPIEINGENYTVKVGGIENFSVLNGEFITLLPGQNQINIDAGGNKNLKAVFDFSFKYI